MGNYFKNAPLVPKEESSIEKHESVMERHERLQKAWEDKLPCKDCIISEVCKYHSVATKRIDYPEEVFDISFSCKTKNNIVYGLDLAKSNINSTEDEDTDLMWGTHA